MVYRGLVIVRVRIGGRFMIRVWGRSNYTCSYIANVVQL